MENSKFFIGLGLGTIAGVFAYRFSRTGKCRKLKRKVCQAMHSMGDHAGGMFENAKEKVWNVGTEAAERVADKAHEAADKADEVKSKVHSFASDMK